MEVERLIKLDMSPEQAAQRLALEGGLQISHETIYLHVYADKRQDGNCGDTCAVRNRAGSDTPADKNGAV